MLHNFNPVWNLICNFLIRRNLWRGRRRGTRARREWFASGGRVRGPTFALHYDVLITTSRSRWRRPFFCSATKDTVLLLFEGRVVLFSKKGSFSQDKLRLFCIVILPSFRKVVKETDYYAECYPSSSPPLHSSFLLTGLPDAFTMSVGAREREACSRLHSKQHHLKGGTKTVVLLLNVGPANLINMSYICHKSITKLSFT